MTSIAIIICTWNRAALLRGTLMSLQKQIVPANTEVDVIVVDNNSSDDTKPMVEQLCNEWQPGTLHYTFERRQGKQFALNAGIAVSRSELLAFTDDDIILPPDWIANICSAFENSQIQLVGGKTLLAWPEAGIPSWYAPDMAAILGEVDIGAQRLCPPPPHYAPAGANLVARRSLFDRVGLFSDTHFRHMDYEFGLRCAKAQVGIAYDPSLVVLAPVDARILSKRYFRRWSFKAGIAGSGAAPASETAKFFGVPRWIFRRLLSDLVCLPVELLLKPHAKAFARELRIWRDLGTIASAWYSRIWPQRYPQWMERYSQKTNNLY
jgi:glycosyltransferase involved in cell wall biosynthesis